MAFYHFVSYILNAADAMSRAALYSEAESQSLIPGLLTGLLNVVTGAGALADKNFQTAAAAMSATPHLQELKQNVPGVKSNVLHTFWRNCKQLCVLVLDTILFRYRSGIQVSRDGHVTALALMWQCVRFLSILRAFLNPEVDNPAPPNAGAGPGAGSAAANAFPRARSSSPIDDAVDKKMYLAWRSDIDRMHTVANRVYSVLLALERVNEAETDDRALEVHVV
jgi:hypothetical protein